MPSTKHENRSNDNDRYPFVQRPWFGVLLFDNNDSDARDHCANERSKSNIQSRSDHCKFSKFQQHLSCHLFSPSISHSPRQSHNSRQALTPTAFLSWLRLSIYMAIVSVAIMISFHLKHQPTQIEKQAALPFGIIFWLLSLACLASGLANYIKTVTKYSHREALVQSGWKTQMVSRTLSRVTRSWIAVLTIIGLHRRRERHRGGLCIVPIYKCRR